MNPLKTLSIITLCLLIIGCDQNNDSRLSKLENGIIKQQDNLEKINQQISDITSTTYQMAIEKSSKEVAIFTPNTKEFQSIQTNLGILFVKIVDIKQYGNGYKIIISIGNPNNAVFTDVDIRVSFGRSYEGKNIIDFSKAHEYKTTITDNLLPGYWNNESLILAPAEKEDIENIWIELSPNQTILKVSPDKSKTEDN